ncbi:hypothetical protein G6O67_007823 [Ophiocordyceps sinensis]|uniref:2EXR domain-containing protein n=1 Tax=Ophiocordyceps sinensis TaxID=72228 RepID=A0A8H4LV46_9HYPO|nr:hypothetical protein G6O67_007823 [Ophiocordyceps sinensis]
MPRPAMSLFSLPDLFSPPDPAERLSPEIDFGRRIDILQRTEAEQERDELDSYDRLVAGGGRPSHPDNMLFTILEAPGEYRDILACWQRHSDDWQVFTPQLRSWERFREKQEVHRSTWRTFSDHAKAVDNCMARNRFKYPASIASASAVLDQDCSLQGDLATWIEYIYFQYRQLQAHQKLVREFEDGHEAAARKLLDSGVLAPHERDRDMLEHLCDPAGEHVARHMIERRYYALHAKDGLKRMDRRTDAMAEFHKTTEDFRSALHNLERHKTRFSWALAQFPLIEQELAAEAEAEVAAAEAAAKAAAEAAAAEAEAEAAAAAAAAAGPSTFESFMRLPPEVRSMIWLDCLPAGPSSHFFDIVNHPRKPHMAHSWSSNEFSVSATPARDSAYLPVYALLATCRESRFVVDAYYRHRSPGANETYEGWCSPENPFGDFETFDWIPAQDLVVLCFPPRQAQLPYARALTLARGPARNVGILVTREMYHLWGYGPDYNGGRPDIKYDGWRCANGPYHNDLYEVDHDGTQMRLIPHFLEHLRLDAGSEPAGDKGEGGVKTLHVIVEGLQGSTKWIGTEGVPPGDVPSHLHCEALDAVCGGAG